MTSQKTQFGPVIAETIIESEKQLPPKVTDLFNKITISLQRRNADE